MLKLVKFFVIVFVLSDAAFAATNKVKVSAENVIVTHFKAWTTSAGGCDKITSFKSPWANRGTVEAVLACQALLLGGYNGTFELTEVPNYSRGLSEALEGHVNMPAESVWDSEIDHNKFYATEPVISKGEFQKGIYIKPSSIDKIKITSAEDLKKYSAAMSKLWAVDWKTLESLKIKTTDVAKKELMFKLVDGGRVDFTMLEFSSKPDMSVEADGVTLVPVHGVKISLAGQRSFVVSKAAPHALEIYTALEKGLSLLRKKGVIQKAWLDSGFISEATAQWKLLN